MESVHGISVSGGSFPAEIWRLFMEPALEDVEPTDFAEPTFWPEWQPFTRGEYALTYDPYYTPPEEEDEEGEEGEGEKSDKGKDENADEKPAEPQEPRAGVGRG